jgi:hypothetical protein
METIVVSRRGVFWFFGCLSGILLAVLSVAILATGSTKTEGLFVAIIGAPVFILMTLYLGTIRYMISSKGIVISSVFGKSQAKWGEFKSIRVPAISGYTFFLGFNIVLFRSERRGLSIPASIFANRHDLVRAVIEAAKIGHQGIEVDEFLTDKYGRPPYGFFRPVKGR